MVCIIVTSNISTVDGSGEHVTHNLEGTIDMYGTAGGDNAIGRLRIRGDFNDLRRVIGDGGICQCCIRRVETESAAGEVVGQGWGTGD